jgi:hypothetical protein
MRILAFVTEPRVIVKILRHLPAKEVDARSSRTADTDAAFFAYHVHPY